MSNPSFGPPPGLSPAMPAQSTNPAPQNPKAQMDDRLTIGPCIISYPALLVPKKSMRDPNILEYGAEFIVLMETPEQVAQAQQIYQRMALVANTVSHAKFQRNADAFRNKPLRPLSERKGFESRPGFFFSARSGHEYKPAALVGNPPVPATDPDQIYAGAIVYCTVKAGTYDNGGNQGVKWYLNSVLKVGDGPRLAGDHDPTDDYADILANMPVSQPAAPAYGMPPMAPPGYGQPPQFQAPPAYAPPMAQPQYPAYGVPPMQQQYAQPPQFQSPPMPGYPQQS